MQADCFFTSFSILVSLRNLQCSRGYAHPSKLRHYISILTEMIKIYAEVVTLFYKYFISKSMFHNFIKSITLTTSLRLILRSFINLNVCTLIQHHLDLRSFII